MATITTNTFLDGGVARTAGETWNISNGAILTVRTDTRWHANAPASMTGTLGAITLATPVGGGLLVEGRNVRWLAFDTGSGNVPAIGTTITQGGVSGYLLGVWANYTSAPTAVGAAMPATGFIKFREVTGGTFSAGALTGISASATGADVTGWVEVVFDLGAVHNNSSLLGLGFQTEGSWFYLDSTNGTPGQIMQVPTNGGGAETRVPAIQIETSPGSNIYKWWSGCYSTPWTTATAGIRPAVDARSRLYQVLDNGQIRLGSDGTTNIGYTPPSGCKVRIPNIFLRQATTSARASNTNNFTNITSGARFTGIGNYNFKKVLSDVGFFAQTSNIFSIQDSGISTQIDLTNNRGGFTIDSVCRGDSKAFWNENTINCTGNANSGTINDFQSFQYSTGSRFINLPSSSSNINITNCVGYLIPSSVSSIATWNVDGGNITLSNLQLQGMPISFGNASYNNRLLNFDYIERTAGDTQTTGSSFLISVSGSGHLIDGVSWGNNGQFSNCHPRASTAIINFSGPVTGCIVRNVGAFDNILSTGATAGTRPTRGIYFVTNSGTTTGKPIKVQRIFVSAVQQAMLETADYFQYNAIIEQVYINTSASTGTWPIGQDFQVKGYWTLNTLPSGSYTNAAGSYFVDFFNSSTTGRVALLFTQPTTSTASFVTTSFTSSNSGFTSNGVSLTSVGEYIITECPWFIRGHTGFLNNAISSFNGSNQANHLFEYDIDTGSGFSGTYKTINGSNLSSESINSDIGFKLRIKVTCTVANTSNRVGFFFLNTSTTSAASLKNLYVLDTSTLSFTGLQPGTEVRAYAGTDPATAVEIGAVESTAGSTFSFTHSSGGVAGYIQIFALGYQPITIPYTYKSTDDSLLIQQVIDRNYVNPV